MSGEDIVFALEATQSVSALEWEDSDGESHELSIGVDDEEKNIDRIAVSEALKRLSAEEELLIRLRYFHGLTQQKTAELLGLTQVKVSRDDGLNKSIMCGTISLYLKNLYEKRKKH